MIGYHYIVVGQVVVVVQQYHHKQSHTKSWETHVQSSEAAELSTRELQGPFLKVVSYVKLYPKALRQVKDRRLSPPGIIC